MSGFSYKWNSPNRDDSRMLFCALASDYDGTLAHDGRVDECTLLDELAAEAQTLESRPDAAETRAAIAEAIKRRYAAADVG